MIVIFPHARRNKLESVKFQRLFNNLSNNLFQFSAFQPLMCDSKWSYFTFLFKSSAENTLSSNFLQLALYVLSFLEPRDLLQAAQTCRYWRILAEDNLLWREKCKEEGKAVQNVGCNGQSVAIIKSAVHLHNELKVLQRQFI